MAKKNSTLIPFGSIVVRDEAGNFDREATLDKVASQYDVWAELQTKDLPALADAIEGVYAQHGMSAAIPIPTLISLAVAKVGFTPATHKELQARARQVVDSNPRYQIVKGAGGGLTRLSDDQLASFEATGEWTKVDSQ